MSAGVVSQKYADVLKLHIEQLESALRDVRTAINAFFVDDDSEALTDALAIIENALEERR